MRALTNPFTPCLNASLLPLPSAEGGLFFQFRPETEKDKKNRENREIRAKKTLTIPPTKAIRSQHEP